MPLMVPVAAALALATAVYGAKKGHDGASAMLRARRVGRQAEAKLKARVAELEQSREETARAIRRYDRARREALGDVFPRLFEFLERLEHRGRQRALKALRGASVGPTDMRRFVAKYVELGGVVNGSFSAVSAGASAGAVATGLVTTFGSAGTGTAIAGLSGAAAKSAMLAWLGGGPIAAGGFGVAGGTLVLGGITLAPALLVGGFVLAHQGEKALTKAEKYAHRARRERKRIKALMVLLAAVALRAEELRTVVKDLSRRAAHAIDELETVAADFDPDRPDHTRRFSLAMLLARALVDVIHTPLLDEDDKPNVELDEVLETARGLLDDEVTT